MALLWIKYLYKIFINIENVNKLNYILIIIQYISIKNYKIKKKYSVSG